MKNHRILWVDDDPQVIKSFERLLRSKFTIESARSGPCGLEMLKDSEPFSVLVTDMTMPEMDGVDLLKRIHTDYPDVVPIMLTGNQDKETAIRATNEGSVFRFLNKPISVSDISEALYAAIIEHQVLAAKRDLLDKTLSGCVRVLTDVIQIIDPVIFADNLRARNFIQKLRHPLKLRNVSTLLLANMLSGIGLISIPTAYLVKYHSGGALSAEERKLFARIPLISESILSHVPRMEEVRKIMKYLSKNFDGTGCPEDVIRGEHIPWDSRFLKIVKDLATLCSEDVELRAAFQDLHKRVGWYDPQILSQVETVLVRDSSDLVEESVQQPDLAEPELVQVGIHELQVGHRLISRVETTDGTLLLEAGEMITPVFLERLKNYSELLGIQEPIYIESLTPMDLVAH